MAIPVLKLNLAPPPTFWRQYHDAIGWTAMALGTVAFAAALGFTWKAYHQANLAKQEAISYVRRASDAARREGDILDQLRSVDVAKELPRWKLAERILGERGLPWSRLMAELERSLVQDVRLKSIQRTRGADQQVQMKLKGEAKGREAEADFVESLQKNAMFTQVILEREAERQGGGVDFDYTLMVSQTPPPYANLPKYGPGPKSRKNAVPQPTPAKAKPAATPSRPASAKPSTIAVPAAQKPAPQPAQSRIQLVPPAPAAAENRMALPQREPRRAGEPVRAGDGSRDSKSPVESPRREKRP